MSHAEMLRLGEFDLIKLAKNAKDKKMLDFLSDSIFTTVRRCVAKNINSSLKTINKLSRDSSENVSYWANKNSNCTNKKEVYSDHPCVLCSRDESEFNACCITCTKVKEYDSNL